ncbi:MAG: DNA-directed DNA polymerase [Candidatus Marsarchaeota archaeon]|nr:DNA-directed DNA polymerase [Candidatus Marsarchaeota archaeon]
MASSGRVKSTPSDVAESPTEGSKEIEVEGFVLDTDYIYENGAGVIRLTIKSIDGSTYEVYDHSFKPYFYLLPKEGVSQHDVESASYRDGDELVKPQQIVAEERSLLGKSMTFFKVIAPNPTVVPKMSAFMSKYGQAYEHDIPFAKRYVIDNDLGSFINQKFRILVQSDRKMELLSTEQRKKEFNDPNLNVMYFDIEVYNPLIVPRPEKDPIIMIGYTYTGAKGQKSGVITFRKTDQNFVEQVADERAMINRFMQLVDELDIDIITGYNSANFDVKYLIDRSKHLGIDFTLNRFREGITKIEKHGMVDRVKIAGRVHVDMYTVVKFISIVGAAESILKLNRYTLKDVYKAISNGKSDKVIVQYEDMIDLWDGSESDVGKLAKYNLGDAESLETVYKTFVPIMIELARVTGDMLSDVCVSTTGQLVEFLLMLYSRKFGEIIPNKPNETEIRNRLANPIEGAFVKTPEPGIYSRLAIFDFRGLYPSIIISHNIDPSSICTDCKDYYEAPNGVKFSKERKSVVPSTIKLLVDQRLEVKKLYKKDPDNIFLGSRSQALKITSNSFYGYLGYARSRWYSRDCAAAVTAYGRQYIKETIKESEDHGFKVIYGDTDSVVLLLGDKTKEEAIGFVKDYNKTLPGNMELELEDFYTRGVFVGKKVEKEGDVAGAKKKYAMISESGRIKIRGFELVRRDWSKVARDTQRKVLETILKEGSAEKAAQIVKDVIAELEGGKVPLEDLAINTQLRKKIDSYDVQSPELSAAKKAVQAGVKDKEEVESAVISYVITKSGSSVSDKAMLLEMAKDYDPQYYINKQVLPAVMRILKELNYDEGQLKGKGSQKKL